MSLADSETLQVLEALKSGPEHAARLLWQMHGRSLGALASRRMPGDADDVVQQAMVHVIEGLRAGYDGVPPLFEWLRRIIRDVGSRQIKRMSRRRALLTTHESAARQKLFTTRFDCPEETARARQRLATLELLVTELGAVDREIFERRFTLRQHPELIGEAVGLSAAAVSVRITRIKASLRKGLGKMEGP